MASKKVLVLDLTDHKQLKAAEKRVQMIRKQLRCGAGHELDNNGLTLRINNLVMNYSFCFPDKDTFVFKQGIQKVRKR